MLILAGFLTGLLVGLTGVGGGALMTPMLLLLFGVAPTTAVGTDLLFAAITKFMASRVHHVHDLIDWQVVKRLWCGSLPGASLCLLAIYKFPTIADGYGFLKMAIAGALILMSFGMIFQKQLHGIGEHLRRTQAEQFKKKQGPLTIAAGVLLGVLVTLTSIGAGALGAVLLVYLYPIRLTPPRLIATDIVHAIPLALFAGLGHLAMGHVDFSMLLYLLIGSIPGVILGAHFSVRLPYQLLRIILAIVLLFVGLKFIATSA